jgi:N6-L-threonylcarbamoyladenine synthase
MRAVLGVDTSCDDTGVGLVDLDSGEILANRVASQDDIHAAFGGVVPERASRQHLAVIDATANAALHEAGVARHEVALVGATYGPGLIGALLVGLSWAKSFAWARSVPWLPVHHLEGHLAAAAPPNPQKHLALIASGGHTSLFLVNPPHERTTVGQTLDDAAGEAFDKVARQLGLGFPGGPALSRLAEEGDPHALDLPVPMQGKSGFDFSFSGIKTAVATRLERQPDLPYADVAAAFERVVVEAIVGTVQRAARAHDTQTVVVAGGVAANARLKEAFGRSGLEVHVAPLALATDNGAMVALAARSRAQEALHTDWAQDAVAYEPWANG